MSPTLLEFAVAIFLLWVAWQIAAWAGPHVIASFLSYWRGPRPPVDRGEWPSEKNITPPNAPGAKSSPSHGPHRQ